MTEPDDQHPDDARAERAFRDAFRERADRLEPATLGPRTSRRRWPVLVAGAAAVAVIAVAATFAVINADDDQPGPDLGAATADATDLPTAGDETPRMRTVSFRGVELEVPVDWRDAQMFEDNGCGYPDAPFVAVENISMVSDLMICSGRATGAPEGFPAAKEKDWSPNVQVTSLAAAAESLPDGRTTYDDWSLTRTTVDGVRIEVLTDNATRAVGRQVLGSVRTVEVDHNGCEATSPVQAIELVRPDPFDIASIDAVTSIAVCQYVRGDTATPGLTASEVLVGGAAQAELEAIQSAPVGGGPNDPQNCAPDLHGEQAVVLRLGDDGAALGDAFVYYDWCFGNGIDDGTTRHSITVENCSPLFVGTLERYSGNGTTFALC